MAGYSDQMFATVRLPLDGFQAVAFSIFFFSGYEKFVSCSPFHTATKWYAGIFVYRDEVQAISGRIYARSWASIQMFICTNVCSTLFMVARPSDMLPLDT